MVVTRDAPAGTPLWVWCLVGLCIATAAGAVYVEWRARAAEEEAALRARTDSVSARKHVIPAAVASGTQAPVKATLP